jgi:hypothetical protein
VQAVRRVDDVRASKLSDPGQIRLPKAEAINVLTNPETASAIDVVAE